MKTFFFFLTILLFLNSCQDQKTEKNIENYTEVLLRFKDYEPNEHKSFIGLTIENGIAPIEQQLKISDSGTVSYNFINKKKRELVFNYENREFSLIVSPNEKLNAAFTIAALTDWKSKFEGCNVISGTNKATNNLILAYTAFVNSLIKQAPNGFNRDGTSTDIAYKNKRITEMQKQL